MSKPEKELIVSKIKNGTVIDHIPAGTALQVLNILGITGREGYRVALVMNVESEKLGKKDIVKVENRELKTEEVNKIALIAPTATINIIRDYKVVKKVKVQLQDIIENIIKCPNPNCVSNLPREPLKPKFRVVERTPIKLKCLYCGRYITRDDIARQLH